ncbi:hypothetical protein PG994_015359 [Apiospora phragmitis]|uniref:Uncharacterized protein n=1 Tax=Apiospora phragmitis TaxID=2905665 RepID=A0ABR1SRN7_9PEZI
MLRSCHSGAFELSTRADAGLLAKTLDPLSFAQAAVLPLGLSTVAIAMFQTHAMALLLPTAPSAAQNKDKDGKKVFLVGGGRPSVGSCDIQLAATAGTRNQDCCQNLSVRWVFDSCDERRGCDRRSPPGPRVYRPKVLSSADCLLPPQPLGLRLVHDAADGVDGLLVGKQRQLDQARPLPPSGLVVEHRVPWPRP